MNESSVPKLIGPVTLDDRFCCDRCDESVRIGDLREWEFEGTAEWWCSTCSSAQEANPTRPIWGCDRWGQHEHDKWRCPECLESRREGRR